MEQRNEQNHKNIYDALLQFMDLASSSWQIGYRYLKTHPELLRKESEEILEEAIVMAKKFNNERSVNLFKLYRDMLILCQEIGVEAAFSKRMGIPLEELKGLIIRDAIQEKTQEIMKKLISAEPDIDISSEEDINRKLAKYPDLQEKLSITTRLVELNDDAPADLLTNLKQALVIDSRCERDSNSTLLIQCAVDSWEHIRHHRNFPQLPEAFQLLVIDGAGNAYLRRYKMTHHQDDLDQAICLLHDEMIHASKYLPRFLFILSSLSESLYIRYKLHMKFQDLEDAIYCMKEAIEKIDDDIENLPRLLNNLGQGLYDRYTQRKQVEDLEQAKECYTKALALTSPDSPTRADCLVGFGHVVASLYQHTRRAPYIPENIPDIADYFLHLGDAFLDLYKQKGELEDLEENIRSYIRAAFHASPSALEISDYLNKIAMSLSLRYRHIGQIENLEQAIEIFQYLLNHVETASPDRALYLGNMASALYDRFMYFENLEDLERAIQYYCQVREVALQHNDQSTVAHSSASLASCLNDWYIHTGKVEYQDEALEVSEKALKRTPSESPDYPTYLYGRALILSTYYERIGRLEDLNEAIQLMETALSHSSSNKLTRLSVFHALGQLLNRRYDRVRTMERRKKIKPWATEREAKEDREMTDLEQSISYLKQGLDLAHPGSFVQSLYLMGLGMALQNSYLDTHKLEDLTESIEMFEQAVQLIPSDAPGWLSTRDDLGTSLLERYKLTKQYKDLKYAIKTFQESEQAMQPGTPGHAIFLGHLARGLQYRYQIMKQSGDLEKARNAYEQVCQEGQFLVPQIVLDRARNWGKWATERGAWEEATHAYSYALAALEQLYRVQLLRSSQETMLSNVRSLHAEAAYAQARAGHLKEAVITLEQGRVRGLSLALARDDVYLERLQKEYPKIYDYYQQLTERLRWLEKVQRESNALAVQQWTMSKWAWSKSAAEKIYYICEERGKIIADIRNISGYEEFLPSLTFSAIQAVVTSSPLVYCAATNAGGLALIMRPEAPGHVTLLWLNSLTEEQLNQKLYLGSPQESYFLSYRFYQKSSGAALPYHLKELQKKYWFRTLENLTEWLWSVLMEPIIEALIPASHIIMVPTGMLGLLPLHAAWKADPATPTKRHYALDDMAITYVPNARTLAMIQPIANRTSCNTLLAVDEPRPANASSLVQSQNEVQIAAVTCTHAQILRHEQATKEAVLASLPNSEVLHFSCHGTINFMEPLASMLLMANNTPLTLSDLLGLRLTTGIRLAVLSACETGIPGLDLPDEVVSLPTGLLLAGIAGIIAPLWSVNETSTELLMIRFYDLWRGEGMHPSEALRESQRWLRDTTDEEKATYIRDYFLSSPFGRQLREDIRENLKNLARKFSNSEQESEHSRMHPFHWAAFSYTGV